MLIMFNTILREVVPVLTDVRLLRHKDNRATRGRSPYELWRDDPPQFEMYQSIQTFPNRKKFAAPFWAVFVANLDDETMFCGLYKVKYLGQLERDMPMPHLEGGIDKAGTRDLYDLTLDDALHDLIGRLFIDWGDGARAWVQYADRQNKPITEIRTSFREESFPGFLNVIKPLSKLNKLPKGWITALKSSRGIYLLTCPKTREQYVGSATGEEGFWGRWQEYVQTGDGGNVALKGREPSDYQVSILEVAGSSATDHDIGEMEGLWQQKLQSNDMGLNRNLASRT